RGEGGVVGRDGKGGGAAGFVGPRQRGRVEVGPDQAFGRARFLDLSDQGIVARRKPPLDRCQKAAGRWSGLGGGLYHTTRTGALRRRDLFALVRLDTGENIGHGDSIAA